MVSGVSVQTNREIVQKLLSCLEMDFNTGEIEEEDEGDEDEGWRACFYYRIATEGTVLCMN